MPKKTSPTAMDKANNAQNNEPITEKAPLADNTNPTDNADKNAEPKSIGRGPDFTKHHETLSKLSPEDIRKMLSGEQRQFVESLGDIWFSLLGIDPPTVMVQVIAKTLDEGGTRPAWQWELPADYTVTNSQHTGIVHPKGEYLVMAWPEVGSLRSAVLLYAEDEQAQLEPCMVFPLLEGFPNDLHITHIEPWRSGSGATVAAAITEEQKPLWFYDPFYLRDRHDLTLGVTQTFTLAGVALYVRKALVDDLVITNGPEYELYAEQWLKENPGKSRLDVPTYRIQVRDRQVIIPGRNYGEYQIRAKIQEIVGLQLNKMPVQMLRFHFPFPDTPGIHIAIYASVLSTRGEKLQVGDEIEAYIWLQGRIIDFDPEEDLQS